MSYYRPSQTAAMTRGRGYSRSSYRGGNSNRGNNWGGGGGGGRGGGGYTPRGGGNRHFDSFSSGFDSRQKFRGHERHSGSRNDGFRKNSYNRSDYGSSRDSGHRSPDRKRLRNGAPSSRHDNSYGGYGSGSGRYDSSYSNQRSFSSDRHQAPPSSPFNRRDEFRKPSGPPRGGYRGRINSRGARGMKQREHSSRRRLIESSYAVRKRVIPTRNTDFARRLKISKMRSAIAARKNKSSTSKEPDEIKEKKDENAEKTESTETELKSEESVEGTKDKSDDKDVKMEIDETGSDIDEKHEKGDDSSRKTFIKLNCPYCGIKAVTFRKYELHLTSRNHVMSMRKVSLKQKSILAQMRLAQRNAQNELEKTSEDLTPRTNFCPLCKLNYKQRKAIHQSSEAHKNMKKFLMPFCKVCSLTFKSPMMYESHCCSVEHLKRKQRVENGDNSDEFDDENNLENFTTIDSVGIDGEPSEEEEVVKTPKVDLQVKEQVNVGIEQIPKIEAYFCDLCRIYVGKATDDNITAILTRHCKQRNHMQRYIRYKEDKDIEKRAEKLQRKETAEREKQTEGSLDNVSVEITVDDGKKDAKGKKSETPTKSTNEEDTRDDKLWADVDKDLDDILATKEGNKSSDEDEEDINGERYDRFKYSEKNGDGVPKEDGKETVKNVEPKDDLVVDKSK